ncbi:MmgE/PrpD family protein [Paenibacillus sp. S150]|uniref:MmgE/PrpD family protein n=1 Tax=Paenibacillus sp. S150 TaxID=2749826 RepID=UPI001C59D8FC|nr:MmgE/PrpD family protein [Paenibacillus sp. S150]MBW4079811.1 MmgE/PrpD family protein [Paenibacillus sp. S150]
MNVLKELVKRVTGLSWEQLEKRTADAAKLTLIDTLGAQIFGNLEQENISYAERVSAEEAGKYAVLGTHYLLTAREAAFVNGCGAVATEMDEGNQWSKGHPAAHVIPTLLTYVQGMKNCTGREFLLALIGGYEASSRFGRATTLLPEAHAHGTWGVMGSAASAMLLAGTEESRFFEGVKLGASFALPTLWSAALEGSLVRNAYMGHTVQSGVRIPLLLNSGFRSPNGTVEYIFGRVLGTAFDFAVLNEPEGWDIERNYFKPYAFCRYAHAPIDAFGALLDEHGLEAGDIAKVEVLTYNRAATLDNKAPQNVLSAKFSIPYALAVRICTGNADQNSFTDPLLENRDIRRFAECVEVRGSEELEAVYPSAMPAIVRITQSNGQLHESRCDMAAGGPGVPLTRRQIEDKFRALSRKALVPERQEAILQYIWDLENRNHLSELIELCRGMEDSHK